MIGGLLLIGLQRKIGRQDAGRTLLRLLQIIHIPLATVVIVAAGLLGLATVRTRRNRTIHGAVALLAFGLAWVHILTA